MIRRKYKKEMERYKKRDGKEAHCEKIMRLFSCKM